VRAIRNPLNVARILGGAGFRTPALSDSPAHLPRDGSWLVKPVRSAGGRGIHALVSATDATDEGLYFQERVDGLALSAVFVAAGGEARLLGVTRQLLGIPGEPFVYRGNLGPWPLPPRVRNRIAQLGAVISANLPVLGLFGVDFVLHGSEPWLVEINPRYTGAVEVLELACRRGLFGHHVNACCNLAIFGPEALAGTHNVVGKAILYAAQDMVIGELLPLTTLPAADRFCVPELADIPDAGAEFRAGEPVVTVFSEADSPEGCAERLEATASLWSARLRLGDSPDFSAFRESRGQGFV
jgi:predicted ATP-grasp superfamily ATP-dependent carboligase